MRKYLVLGAALALLSPQAQAQAPQPSLEQLEQQVERSRLGMIAAQAQFYLDTAKAQERRLAEQAAQAAATARWWDAWWAGMFPKPADTPDKKAE